MKALGIIMIILGVALGLPGVVLTLSIVGAVIGVPLVCASAALVVPGIKVLKGIRREMAS